MTPEQALAEMTEAIGGDRECAHIAADNVLVDIARAAGYGEAADLWEASSSEWWWA